MLQLITQTTLSRAWLVEYVNFYAVGGDSLVLGCHDKAFTFFVQIAITQPFLLL